MTFPLIFLILGIMIVAAAICGIWIRGTTTIILVWGVLMVFFMAGGYLIEVNFSHSEIKTVTICEKFTDGKNLLASLSDGNTYVVEDNVYGYLPKSVNVTVGLKTSALMGETRIDKLISPPACGVGCGT